MKVVYMVHLLVLPAETVTYLSFTGTVLPLVSKNLLLPEVIVLHCASLSQTSEQFQWRMHDQRAGYVNCGCDGGNVTAVRPSPALISGGACAVGVSSSIFGVFFPDGGRVPAFLPPSPRRESPYAFQHELPKY